MWSAGSSPATKSLENAAPVCREDLSEEEVIFMAKNVGGADRVIRIILGVILLALGIWYFGGVWQWVSGIVGAIFLLTSVVSFCPLLPVL